MFFTKSYQIKKTIQIFAFIFKNIKEDSFKRKTKLRTMTQLGIVKKNNI
jgi:hypothetical protein